MSEVNEQVSGCFLEDIMVVNSDPGGLEIEARQSVRASIETGANRGVYTIVECGRCATSFSVDLAGAVTLADYKFGCDKGWGIDKQKAAGDLLLNINMVKLRSS